MDILKNSNYMLFEKKNIVKILLFFVVIFIVLEFVARFILGLGDTPLYIEDKEYEYILAPNQKVKRFGNIIMTNEFSMRSKPLSKEDEIIILKIGDSVINGGSLTTQDSLASTILEEKLDKEFKKKIRVLNISSGSWGPDNAMEYIKKYGHFNASLIVLIFSSHDLYDIMTHKKIVGVDKSYPDTKPLLALYEGFSRYFIPMINTYFNKNIYHENNSIKLNERKKINPGWEFFIRYTKNNNIDLLVELHPTVTEIKQGKYNSYGQKIISILDSTGTKYLLELNKGISKNMYRDNIHFNNKGQKFIEQLLYPYLIEHIQKENNI